jgi:transcriptional regulator with XRE-family HTH domain
MYKECRKNSGKTIDGAAEDLFVAPRTLAKYESGELTPSPTTVMAMAKAYNQPDMVQRYCRVHCAIGQKMGYEVLDNMDKSLPSVVLQLTCEVKTAGLALDHLMPLVIGKISRSDFRSQDFSADEWKEFSDSIQAFLDVEHGVAVLRESLAKLIDVSQIVAQHNQKCRDRGYVKKENDRLQAVG